MPPTPKRRLPPRAPAAADPADDGMPDLSAFADLDAGAEEVSDADVGAIFAELGIGDSVPPKRIPATNARLPLLFLSIYSSLQRTLLMKYQVAYPPISLKKT